MSRRRIDLGSERDKDDALLTAGVWRLDQRGPHGLKAPSDRLTAEEKTLGQLVQRFRRPGIAILALDDLADPREWEMLGIQPLSGRR